MRSVSKLSPAELPRRYSAALKRHLAGTPGAVSRPAARLGREALKAGLDTLDLARIHERALVELLPPGPPSRNGRGIVLRAAAFFLEALTPVEKTHRVALENDGHLTRLNGTVRRRDVELAATRRRLRREIARRKTAEQAVRKSARYHSALLTKARHMQEHLRDLSHKILATQETERERISRELHDEVGQTLTGINVLLATLNREATLNSKDLKRKLATTQRLVERSMKTVHRFARELRPPLLDDLGLIPALHSFMNSFTKRTRIRVDFKTFAEVERLSREKRTALFRVAQEALTNVLKHAKASSVAVSIRREKGEVCMDVIDDGKSFDVDRVMFAKRIRRLGLLGMRERMEMVGGTLTIESEPGHGTTVRARVPFRGSR